MLLMSLSGNKSDKNGCTESGCTARKKGVYVIQEIDIVDDMNMRSGNCLYRARDGIQF